MLLLVYLLQRPDVLQRRTQDFAYLHTLAETHVDCMKVNVQIKQPPQCINIGFQKQCRFGEKVAGYSSEASAQGTLCLSACVCVCGTILLSVCLFVCHPSNTTQSSTLKSLDSIPYWQMPDKQVSNFDVDFGNTGTLSSVILKPFTNAYCLCPFISFHCLHCLSLRSLVMWLCCIPGYWSNGHDWPHDPYKMIK